MFPNRSRLARLLVLGLLWGCAKSEAPSGGPLDIDPPKVSASYPDSGAIGVGAIDSLAIVFSERMNRRSVEQSFQMVPAVDVVRREWNDRTWTLRLREPLTARTTYVGLVGAETVDRRRNSLGRLWKFAFATGDTLDDGVATGKIFGQRFAAQRLWVYAWPWEVGYPDTTLEGFPSPPLRLGQSDDQGLFRMEHLPHHQALRVCAFYDRDGDGQFQPLPDRWACWPDSIVIVEDSAGPDSLTLFLADPDEPGTLAGTVVDSSCAEAVSRHLLARTRAERDSLLEWLEGEYDARERGRGTLTRRDSLRIEKQFAQFRTQELQARQDSALCAQPIRVELYASLDSLVQSQEGAEFRWTDVASGVYRLRAFRDVNGNAVRDPGEATGAYGFSVDVAPLRVLDELTIILAIPAGEAPLRPEPAAEAEAKEDP